MQDKFHLAYMLKMIATLEKMSFTNIEHKNATKKGKCPPSRTKHQHLYQIRERKEIKIQKEEESEK